MTEYIKPHIRYTSSVGTKFFPDGRVRSYPGNTVICPFSTDPQIQPHLVWAQEQFIKLNCANKWAFLPPNSFHMTVMDLVCDEERIPAKWSTHFPISTSLGDLDHNFREKINALKHPTYFTMEFISLFAGEVLVIVLCPANPDSANSVKIFRDQVSQVTGVKGPNFDGYIFHITLAYKLIELESDEQMEIDNCITGTNQYLHHNLNIIRTGQPKFMLFNNMYHFSADLVRNSNDPPRSKLNGQ
jgi:hypothetical protein